jgi:hypothetical protein
MAELYAGDPESFTGRRGELVTAARDAGDRAAAKAIGALRRPTRVAWVVNTLARAAPDTPAALAQLAAGLREAQQAKDGRRLRELSAERGELIDALTQRALSAAGVTDVPPALRLEVSQTLTAALADPEIAAQFAAGTLTRAVQWSGFGVLPADTGPAAAEDTESGSAQDTESGGTKTAGTAMEKSRPPAGRTRLKAVPAEPAKPDAAAARRQAEAEKRAAREAAERAAVQRKQSEEAERAVTEAADRAAEAGSAEDRLETEVRDLEERLTQARTELRDARLRARQTEGAERRARQALSRLPD